MQEALPDLKDKFDYEAKAGDGVIMLPSKKDVKDNIGVVHQHMHSDSDVMCKTFRGL
jgi:hypothetical protein